MTHRIMLVDDEEGVLSALRRLLRATPCTYGNLNFAVETECFASPEAALVRIAEADFDVIVTDYRMPGMNGVEFLRRAKAIQPSAVRLILSGQADREVVERAFDEVRIYRFVAKPWNDSLLMSAIAEALNHHDLLAEAGRSESAG